jgi:hypothetical protein
MSEIIAVILFTLLCVSIYTTNMNQEVKVHFCELNGKTTYVGKKEPSKLLKLGACHTKPMTNEKYLDVRSQWIRR